MKALTLDTEQIKFCGSNTICALYKNIIIDEKVNKFSWVIEKNVII